MLMVTKMDSYQYWGFISADMDGLLEICFWKIWELHFPTSFQCMLGEVDKILEEIGKMSKRHEQKGERLRDDAACIASGGVAVAGHRVGEAERISKRLQGLEEDGREQFCGALVNVRV